MCVKTSFSDFSDVYGNLNEGGYVDVSIMTFHDALRPMVMRHLMLDRFGSSAPHLFFEADNGAILAFDVIDFDNLRPDEVMFGLQSSAENIFGSMNYDVLSAARSSMAQVLVEVMPFRFIFLLKDIGGGISTLQIIYRRAKSHKGVVCDYCKMMNKISDFYNILKINFSMPAVAYMAQGIGFIRFGEILRIYGHPVLLLKKKRTKEVIVVPGIKNSIYNDVVCMRM